MDRREQSRTSPGSVQGSLREAAVLIPIVEGPGKRRLLFTRRADSLEEHPGQMCFPGGAREPDDVDLSETALREANEEISLRREEVDLVGSLPVIRTVTAYQVTPFVAHVPDRKYRVQESEVAELVALPIDQFTDHHRYRREPHPERPDNWVDYFQVGGYLVWGATGRIVVLLLEHTEGWSRP